MTPASSMATVCARSASPSSRARPRCDSSSAAKPRATSSSDGGEARRAPTSRTSSAPAMAASPVVRRRLALLGVPATGAQQRLGDRLQRLEAQPGAQRLDGEHGAGIDVAQADVLPEAVDQRCLLRLERRLPDEARRAIAHGAGYGLDRFEADVAVLVVDADAAARLATLDDDVLGAPLQILQRLRRELRRGRLCARVLFAHLGDGREPGLLGARDGPLAAKGGK